MTDSEKMQSQLRLQQAMGHAIPRTVQNPNIEQIRNWILAAMVELGEALQELNWKPWRTYEEGPDYITPASFFEELIDVQHFVYNAALHAGCTPELWDAFWEKKHAENWRRLQEGTNKVLEQNA